MNSANRKNHENILNSEKVQIKTDLMVTTLGCQGFQEYVDEGMDRLTDLLPDRIPEDIVYFLFVLKSALLNEDVSRLCFKKWDEIKMGADVMMAEIMQIEAMSVKKESIDDAQ